MCVVFISCLRLFELLSSDIDVWRGFVSLTSDDVLIRWWIANWFYLIRNLKVTNNRVLIRSHTLLFDLAWPYSIRAKSKNKHGFYCAEQQYIILNLTISSLTYIDHSFPRLVEVLQFEHSLLGPVLCCLPVFINTFNIPPIQQKRRYFFPVLLQNCLDGISIKPV